MFKTLQKYKHFSDSANNFALLLPLFTTFMTAYKKLLLSLPPKRHEIPHNKGMGNLSGGAGST